jgi:Spy/CpxP family protein refolding chaperone
MSLRRVSALAILLLAAGGAGAVALAESSPQLFHQAGQKQNPPYGMPGGNMSQMIQQLGLTTAQQQQLQAERQQCQTQATPIKQQLQSAEQTLRNDMAGTASDQTITTDYTTVKNLHSQLGDIEFQCMLKMRDVLTPDQRQKWAQMMQQRMQRQPRPFPRSSMSPQPTPIPTPSPSGLPNR